MAASKRRPPKPALPPDALIAASKDARIRLIEKRRPRRKKRPLPPPRQ
jgi:hypothetical protein